MKEFKQGDTYEYDDIVVEVVTTTQNYVIIAYENGEEDCLTKGQANDHLMKDKYKVMCDVIKSYFLGTDHHLSDAAINVLVNNIEAELEK